ncbi:protein ABHD15 [Protopterus annectens]|uniref:protein ABHD15 n=1 Tax=Protopterus annectens TaxID=7888 RepID=UPI001CFC23E7|nr:protein ABHD15 [Protopterus annectens]
MLWGIVAGVFLLIFLCLGRRLLCSKIKSGTVFSTGKHGNTKEEEDEEDDDFGLLQYSEKVQGGSPLICKSSALATYLLDTCPAFSETTGSGWSQIIWAHLHTILNLFFPVETEIEIARDHLQLLDQGIVSLDWVVGPHPPSKSRRATNIFPSPPILLIIPNSFGRITRNVQQLCSLAMEQGYYPVIFNRRGHNRCPLTTLKLQEFGDPSDLQAAISYIRFRHPSSKIFAVSESSGSGLLLSYMGEWGSSTYVTGAVCISPIFRCQEWFESRMLWFYRWTILLYQKFCHSRYATVLGDIIYTERLFHSSSLWEFEELLFCHTKRKAVSWQSYWERNEPLRDVDEVAVPVLCICSKDDPIRGNVDSTLPLELFKTNPYLFLWLTKHGGHCGFISQDSTIWSHRATLQFFKSVTEFFRMEERRLSGPRRSSVLLYRQRRGTLQKRERAYSSINIFNWQRSYTR